MPARNGQWMLLVLVFVLVTGSDASNLRNSYASHIETDAAVGYVGERLTEVKPSTAAAGPRIADTQHAAQQTYRKLSQAEQNAAAAIASPAAPSAGGHKGLFPVDSLEVAVLVIAGVVLFIAAGRVLSSHSVRPSASKKRSHPLFLLLPAHRACRRHVCRVWWMHTNVVTGAAITV